jgi:hypothetical protein
MPTLQFLFDEAATEAEQQWLTTKQQAPLPGLLAAFVAAPRFVKRRNVPGKPNWTMDQLARVLLLQTLCETYPAEATRAVETLFDTAEMQELAALYSALPLLPQPGHWLLRATDAVRSNMGPVFEAIAFENTYPAAHFSEAAWNQLVLKCIFNDKPISRIVGLHERANDALAQHLSDLAHERWAAGRHVPAEAWLLVRKFVTETIRQDLLHLRQSDREEDREIAEKLMKNEPLTRTRRSRSAR